MNANNFGFFCWRRTILDAPMSFPAKCLHYRRRGATRAFVNAWEER